jgi:hypothetical protein
MSGAVTQREIRRSDSPDVRFAPESDRLLRGSEMTRWAMSDQSALQTERPYGPAPTTTASTIDIKGSFVA